MNRIQKHIKTKGYSFWSLIFLTVFFLSADLLHHKWMKDDPKARAIIKHDVKGYYGYLPAKHIYKDITLGFIGEPGFKNENRFMALKLENGNRLIQYTRGNSILYSPFFFMAHAVAPVFGQERDGYNRVYQFFLVMSALFYVTIGLFLLRILLLRYFSDKVTALTLLLLGLASNIFYYTVYEAAMSHSYSFALIAAFLFLVDNWYKRTCIGRTALLGLTFGLLTLVRPTNALVIFMLVLWQVKSWDDLKVRFIFLLKKWPYILEMIVFFLIPWVPQFAYWKLVTGQILYNSYEQVGSAFYFDAPQTWHMLFSFRKGWLIYTPLMIFGLAGFAALYRSKKEHFWSSSVYMIAMIYVMSSWWSWWFGGGFGSRSMVDAYPIMAIPLAAGVAWVLSAKNTVLKLGFGALAGILLALNLLQTGQYNHNSIHYVSMDRDAYFHNFFKVKGRGHWGKLSDPDHQLARLGIYYFYDWSDDYEAFAALNPVEGKRNIATELHENAKTIRSIKRHAQRNELSQEEAMEMVIERIYDRKSSRKNLK